MTTPANAVYVNDGNVTAYPTNENGEVVIGERPMEEIEGSLLPVAREIQGVTQVMEIDGHSTMDATPMETFDYDTAIAAEREQEQEPLVAHHVPSGLEHNPDSIADDSRNTVKHAERTGIQRAEEEKDAIRKANRKVNAHNYFEEKEFQVANAKAKQRNQEGLQVLPPPPPSVVSSSSSSQPQGDKKAKHKDAGYEVQEYKIADAYETESYNVKEYKSVYD